MKRSEMIAKITEELQKDNSPKTSATLVLSLIEELGMLPPERVYWNRKKDGSLMPSSKNGEMVNSWDPE
jgi:hypothetical protein